VPSPVAARRLELCAAARADPPAFLRFDPARLRVSLGTSLTDLAVPVEVTAEAQAIVRAAASEVALLLVTFHKRFVPVDQTDRLLLREDYARLPPVPPTLGPATGGPDLRAAAALCAASHPALPGGLAGAWLGKGGKGRSLVGLWIELVRRALVESEGPRGEETTLIVSIALAAELAAAEAQVKEILPTGSVERYLRPAAMTALWVAGRTGLALAFRDAGRGPDDPALARAEAVLSPLRLLGGRGVATGSTLYGCDLSTGVPRAEDLAARLAGGADPEAVVADLLTHLSADEAVTLRCEQAVAVARLREGMAGAILQAEAAGQEGRVGPLRELLAAPGGLAAGAGDVTGRQGLVRQLQACLPAGEAAGALDRLTRVLREWRPREPAGALGLTREEARVEYARTALALCADLALEQLATPVRRAVRFRTGREAEGGADAEYEAGRLYRLDARSQPILLEAVERPIGHLFADVKDFTRRTALVGQASMAEFLRTEFYLPILTAAKEHFTGMRHLSDMGGIQLNNLLGDAISFSGRIESMVLLAQAIRRAFAAYSGRLAREAEGEAVQRQLAALRARLDAAVEAATRARMEAELAVPRATGGPAVQVAARVLAERLAAEEARQVEERQRVLARARGEGLEAGVFISFGPPPLTVTIEDDVFGQNRVAIADKINESARGTARAPTARVRADARLATERTARGNPRLQHAWSVFIGQPLTLTIGPEVEDLAVAALRAGDPKGGMKVLARPVRAALEAAARDPQERSGDIYNNGGALSEEALRAFLEEVRGRRVVRRVELSPDEVPEALRAAWFFGDQPQTLLACFHLDGQPAELFRRVGRAGFKGLGAVAVWELCGEGGGPAALLAALGPAWLGAPAQTPRPPGG